MIIILKKIVLKIVTTIIDNVDHNMNLLSNSQNSAKPFGNRHIMQSEKVKKHKTY